MIGCHFYFAFKFNFIRLDIASFIYIMNNRWLIASSHTSLFSAIYCIHHGIRWHWIYPLGVYINSINYWRYPVRGMRRNVDMAFGCSGLAVSLIYSYWNVADLWAYYWLTFLACFMYPISCWLHAHNYFMLSTIAHMMIHLFGNAGKIVLYNQIKT